MLFPETPLMVKLLLVSRCPFAQTSIRARSVQKVCTHAWAENGSLRKAPGAQRYFRNLLVVKSVASRSIRRVEKGRRSDCHLGSYSTRLKLGVERHCPVALHQNLVVDGGLEAILDERDFVVADGEIGSAERAIIFRLRRH